MSQLTVLHRTYPEFGAGGFSRYDGSVEFYGRINGLIEEHFHVLDIGAGRGAWHFDDKCVFRKALRTLKGKVKEVVGVDVDDAVLGNPTVDRAFVVSPGSSLPFPDQSFDVVIADYVLEHVDDAASFAGEVSRVLRPGGWLCARTPNKWGYVSIGTRLVSNSHHIGVLQRAQPERRAIDVFETRFQLNTLAAIRKHFPSDLFDSFCYTYQAEPSYYFGRKWILNSMRILDRALPRFLRANLFVFLRKRSDAQETQMHVANY